MIDTDTRLLLAFTGGPTGPFTEKVRAVSSYGMYELREHSTFAPLAPGDLVLVTERERSLYVTEVASLEETYTVEATLHLPRGVTFAQQMNAEHPAMRAVNECYEEWLRDAYVTRNTSFSFLVSSTNRDWLTDKVEGHPYVEHVDWIRRPGMKADLDSWLANPMF